MICILVLTKRNDGRTLDKTFVKQATPARAGKMRKMLQAGGSALATRTLLGEADNWRRTLPNLHTGGADASAQGTENVRNWRLRPRAPAREKPLRGLAAPYNEKKHKTQSCGQQPNLPMKSDCVLKSPKPAHMGRDTGFWTTKLCRTCPQAKKVQARQPSAILRSANSGKNQVGRSAPQTLPKLPIQHAPPK